MRVAEKGTLTQLCSSRCSSASTCSHPMAAPYHPCKSKQHRPPGSAPATSLESFQCSSASAATHAPAPPKAPHPLPPKQQRQPGGAPRTSLESFRCSSASSRSPCGFLASLRPSLSYPMWSSCLYHTSGTSPTAGGGGSQQAFKQLQAGVGGDGCYRGPHACRARVAHRPLLRGDQTSVTLSLVDVPGSHRVRLHNSERHVPAAAANETSWDDMGRHQAVSPPVFLFSRSSSDESLPGSAGCPSGAPSSASNPSSPAPPPAPPLPPPAAPPSAAAPAAALLLLGGPCC